MTYVFQPDRFLLMETISGFKDLIVGKVLDVGSGNFSRYRKLFPCDTYIRMDEDGTAKPDVIGNACKIPFPDCTFNSIVCTQVLGDVFDLNMAAQEFNRVLMPGGIVLITESFFDSLHGGSNDFWRFTNHGIEKLLENNGFAIIETKKRGGFFSVKAQINIRYLIDRFEIYNRRYSRLASYIFKTYGLIMIWLDRLDTSNSNANYTIGWTVAAKKND